MGLIRLALLRDFRSDSLASAMEGFLRRIPPLFLRRRRRLLRRLSLAGKAEAETPAHSDQESSLGSLCAQVLRPVDGFEVVVTSCMRMPKFGIGGMQGAT